MTDYDFYSTQEKPDGTFIILKNGDFFLNCSGSRDDAENIVRLLNKDIERINKKEANYDRIHTV